MNTKQKIFTQKFILSAVFALVFLGGVGKTNDALAGYCTYLYQECYEGNGPCITKTEKVDNCQKSNCNADGTYKGNSAAGQCQYHESAEEANKHQASLNAEAAKRSNQAIKEAVGEPSDGLLTPVIKWLLRGVLTVVGWLISIAATLFEWIIKPESLNAVINNSAIYSTWKIVRDTLNVAFILVLLFTAFSIVFQVDKFSNKKIILTVILMALLVNFSFPISRFIIDFSNIIMYYFLNSLGGSGSFAQIASKGKLAEILNPGSADITFLIAAIIFSFIFAVTILTIAVLLIIRTIALAILVIFSPIAFVGTFVPFLSSKASSWWDNLFKYSFFGPVMVFMIYVAVEMMNKIAINGPSFVSIANVQSDGSLSQFIAAASFFVIPIIILWFGIGTAQSMSIMGASAVVGRGQKFMKWAGKGTYRAPWWGIKQTGVPGGLAQKWKHMQKTGPLSGSDKREEREARRAGGGLFAVPKVVEQLDVKKVKDAKEKHDMENMLPNQLRNIAMTGNKYERAAALLELANKGALEASDKDKNNYEQFTKEFGETSQVFYQLNSKLKGYDPVAAFSHIADNPELWKETIEAHVNSNQFDAKKLSGGSLANAEFMKLMFQNQAISNTDLDDLRKKSIGHEKNIKSSLETVAGDFSNLSESDEKLKKINTNVQMAYFAQHGKLHASIEGNSDYHDHMFSRLSKDTLKRISAESAEKYADDIAANINIGKYKEALPNIENRNAQRTINRKIMDSEDPRAQAMKEAIKNDPRLNNIK